MEEGAQDLVLDKINFNITPLYKYYYPYNCKMVFKYVLPIFPILKL